MKTEQIEPIAFNSFVWRPDLILSPNLNNYVVIKTPQQHLKQIKHNYILNQYQLSISNKNQFAWTNNKASNECLPPNITKQIIFNESKCTTETVDKNQITLIRNIKPISQLMIRTHPKLIQFIRKIRRTHNQSPGRSVA